MHDSNPYPKRLRDGILGHYRQELGQAVYNLRERRLNDSEIRSICRQITLRGSAQLIFLIRVIIGTEKGD